MKNIFNYIDFFKERLFKSNHKCFLKSIKLLNLDNYHNLTHYSNQNSISLIKCYKKIKSLLKNIIVSDVLICKAIIFSLKLSDMQYFILFKKKSIKIPLSFIRHRKFIIGLHTGFTKNRIFWHLNR